MNWFKPLPLLAASLVALGVACTPILAAAQSASTEIHLTRADAGDVTCIFDTEDGIAVQQNNPQVISTRGQFRAGSNCGGTGGGATGPAAATLTVNGGSGPVTIDEGQGVNLAWSATADVCHYGFVGTPPEIVSGWVNGAHACIGAEECAAGKALDPVLTAAGTYAFQLSCSSGKYGSQPQTSATASVTVTVEGDGGGTELPPNCTAPTGMVRDTTGTISVSAGNHQFTNVDVRYWKNVYGFSPPQSGLPKLEWPGYFNNDIKMNIRKDHYWALEFTVGPDYPYYDHWLNTVGPYGTFQSNDTLATPSTVWTLSISECPGDFQRPAVGQPDYYCYVQYTINQGGGLTWVVLPEGQPYPYNGCTLRRNKTYFLNVTPAPLLTPGGGGACALGGTPCRGNFYHKGNFEGSAGM